MLMEYCQESPSKFDDKALALGEVRINALATCWETKKENLG